LNYYEDIGETSLENPLPWDTIPSETYSKLNLTYNKLNLVEPYVDMLRKNSEARIATNQDFVYIQQDIEQTKKLQADKSVTHNERGQIKERETNQARQKARDQEHEARKASGMNIYELTVKNSELPGLPDPMPLTVTNGVAVSSPDSNTNDFSKIHATAKPTPAGTQAAALAVQIEKPVVTKALPVDPMLDETESILEDYISALFANRTLVAQ
jgi:carboxyl-terminal processing protease